MLDLSKQESGALGLFSSVLGHVGDGNFHQAVMYDPSDPAQTHAVQKCVQKMVHRAVDMEGTVSVCCLHQGFIFASLFFFLLIPAQGEHGIGLGKKECLLEELGPETISVMRTLKQSLDPQ